MYMDYSKLWKLLIDKGITKTELMELTSLSSRIITKLTKNETVTTETLAKICSALNCDVSHIMEFKEEKNLSFYNCFRKFGNLTEENENYKTVRFTYNEQNFVVYEIKKPVTKSCAIHCNDDGTIFREQFYPFGGIMSPSSVHSSVIKPLPKSNETGIVLFFGKPNFTNLDNGIFISSKNKNKKANSIYVMTETALKLFTP